MIKTPVLCAALVAVLSFSALAEGARGIYVRADGGVTMPKTNAQHKFKSSSLGSVGVGYHFNDVFTADVNWQMRKLKVDNRGIKLPEMNEIENRGIMINGYLNLTDSGDWMIPYLTAGVGYGTNKIKKSSSTFGPLVDTQLGGKQENIMWNIGVGIAMELIKNLQLDLVYRYSDLGKAKGKLEEDGFTQEIKLKAIKSNEVTIGLIFNF